MRDLTSDTVTEAVISTMRDTKDSRVAEILESLVRHVHTLVREVELTEEEWARGEPRALRVHRRFLQQPGASGNGSAGSAPSNSRRSSTLAKRLNERT
ncbi:dioxygenase [Streptomyces sp. NPDC051664]|uniref:dioxygenase n=1 Tax=Streptomyces sp. NPDC051664 TaxID=3365668 RepID=UPI0037B90662